MKANGILLILAAIACTAVFADEMKTFYWTGGSGNWSDIDNWSMSADGTTKAERYPGAVTNTIDGVDYASTDDVVRFRPSESGTITLDKDVSIWRFTFEEAKQETAMLFESRAENPCKLVMTTDAHNSINSDTSIRGKYTVTFRNIKIKGLSFDMRGGDAIFDTGADIDLGTIYAWDPGCLIRYLDGCTVKATLSSKKQYGTNFIEGGTFTGKISPGSKNFAVRITGGVCDFTSVSLTSNSVFEVSSGDVSISKMKLPATASSVITGGSVFFTHVPVIDPEATFIPRTIQSTSFGITEAKNYTLDLDRVNIGEILNPTIDNASLTIPDGITLGAFGDWHVHNKNFNINLGGNVVLDTTDCFDGVTPRSIHLSKINPMPNLSMTVRGNGVASLSFSEKSSSSLPSLNIESGAELSFTNDTKSLTVDNLIMGAGAKLNLACGKGLIEFVNATIDPTASILVHVESGLTGAVYPIFSSYNDEMATVIAKHTTLVGEDLENNYSICTGSDCIYIVNKNGKQPTYVDIDIGESNIWHGANSGYWNDEKNWHGKVPYSDKYVAEGVKNDAYIAGSQNTDITNNCEGTTYLTRIAFLSSCGPVRISGGKFQLGLNGWENPTSSPIYSCSKFPVIIESDISTKNLLSPNIASDSYIELNGTTQIEKYFRPSGDVRVGGTLNTKMGILMGSAKSNGRTTRMHVLDGGVVTSIQLTNRHASVSSYYIVDKGGKIIFENQNNAICGHYATILPSLVNGEIDIQCPYFTTKDQYYNGTGEIKFASVQSHELGSSSVIVGGGLTVKPASWTTVSAEAPGNYIKIAVTNNAILSACADWTYGPAEGVTPTTSAEERALTLAPNSTLTIKTGGFRVAFADPIIGAGDVVVESESRLALAGELFNEAASLSWTTFAKVKSFTCPEGVFPSTVRLQTVDNGDGTVDVQARIVPGLTISIR